MNRIIRNRENQYIDVSVSKAALKFSKREANSCLSFLTAKAKMEMWSVTRSTVHIRQRHLTFSEAALVVFHG